MSVSISHLTKKYSAQLALDDVSFAAEKGKITGFLGPNGAGKSTTMKIATGFLPASSGTVSIDGLDIAQQTQEAQKKIGYLPEHNPLYLDMYVHEYLEFVGNVYGLKNVKQRAAEIVDRVGLIREQNKKIGSLSKGYRQRVGLSQALIHDPEILILDEPLTGLDPNQIVEIRNLIKELGSNKTVIFSTHIMQEVQFLCDKVVIINKGKIVADKSLSELQNGQKKQKTVVIELSSPFDSGLLNAMYGVQKVISLGPNKARILYSDEVDIRPELFKWTSDQGNSISSLTSEEASLESIFQKLTS